MGLDSVHLTSSTFWWSALVVTLVDAVVVGLLAWRINREKFRQFRWPLVIAATLFWSCFGIWLYQIFWDSYYRFFSPIWLRNGGILLVTVLIGVVVTLFFHWVSLRLPGNPLITFCLLCGLESILEHLWGIFSLKIMEVPMLQGVNTTSILAFAFPEYIFYWSVVILLAVAAQYIRRLFAKEIILH